MYIVSFRQLTWLGIELVELWEPCVANDFPQHARDVRPRWEPALSSPERWPDGDTAQGSDSQYSSDAGPSTGVVYTFPTIAQQVAEQTLSAIEAAEAAVPPTQADPKGASVEGRTHRGPGIGTTDDAMQA